MLSNPGEKLRGIEMDFLLPAVIWLGW